MNQTHKFLVKPTSNIIVALLVGMCSVLLHTSPTLGDYDLSWHTIDSGGGVSSGEQYIVSGTIAQHDAAYSAGDDYELLGGFWPGEPMCFVDFEHFARFADYWLETGTGLPADLYEDDIVNWLDVDAFVYDWLYYCPYDWPLK